MAVVAVYSIKGGVGKTTLAANLAWVSSQVGKTNTLLWDLDAAGGAAFLLGVDHHPRKRAESIFGRRANPAKQLVATGWPGLEILPADESLWSLDAHLAAIGKKRRLAKITEALSISFPRVVLDCPPVLNEVSAQAIRAADVVIVPLPPSPLSTRAFDLVAQEVRGSGKKHPPMLPVLSMVDRRRTLHREAMAENPGWPVIPFTSALEQCAVQRAPVGSFAPRSPSALAIESLWAAIQARLARRGAA